MAAPVGEKCYRCQINFHCYVARKSSPATFYDSADYPKCECDVCDKMNFESQCALCRNNNHCYVTRKINPASVPQQCYCDICAMLSKPRRPGEELSAVGLFEGDDLDCDDPMVGGYNQCYDCGMNRHHRCYDARLQDPKAVSKYCGCELCRMKFDKEQKQAASEPPTKKARKASTKTERKAKNKKQKQQPAKSMTAAFLEEATADDEAAQSLAPLLPIALSGSGSVAKPTAADRKKTAAAAPQPGPEPDEDPELHAEKKALAEVESVGPAPLPKRVGYKHTLLLGYKRTLESLQSRIKWYETGAYFYKQPKKFHQTPLADGSSVVPRAATKGIGFEWRNRAALLDYARCHYEQGVLEIAEHEYARATGSLKTAAFYAARSRGLLGRELMWTALSTLVTQVPDKWVDAVGKSGFTVYKYRVDLPDVMLVLHNIHPERYKHDTSGASLLYAVMPMARAATTTHAVLGISCEVHQDHPCVVADKCRHLRP